MRWAIYVIGCDVGTQSLKAVALDEHGAPVARAKAAYPISHPRPGWAEQDPRDWEAALRATLSQIVAALPADAPAALAIAGQVDGVIPVNRDGDALGPAVIWMDRRATSEAAELAALIDRESCRQITGLNIDASHAAPKIAWLRKQADESAVADAYLTPVGYLVARLTGERVVDHANASSTLLYDIRTRDWSERLLGTIGLEPTALGSIAAAQDVAGAIRPGLAGDLGVDPGCRILVGTGDEHAACLAANALRPGVVCDITGTAEPVAAAALEPVIDADGLVETHGHVLPDRWLVENPGFVSGGSLRWLADSVLQVAQDDLMALAADAPPGSDGAMFMPALGGSMTPRWNDLGKGSFTGLAVGHDRRHLARAVLEGCAYALRDIVDRFDALALGAGRIRVVGGGSRNALWLQIKADVTGRPVELLIEPEATAAGAALLAATAAGFFSDLETAASETLMLNSRVCWPDPGRVEQYEHGYRQYRAVFDALEATFRDPA